MSENREHYTVGDALVLLILALFVSPIGWFVLFAVVTGLLSSCH